MKSVFMNAESLSWWTICWGMPYEVIYFPVRWSYPLLLCLWHDKLLRIEIRRLLQQDNGYFNYCYHEVVLIGHYVSFWMALFQIFPMVLIVPYVGHDFSLFSVWRSRQFSIRCTIHLNRPGQKKFFLIFWKVQKSLGSCYGCGYWPKQRVVEKTIRERKSFSRFYKDPVSVLCSKAG